MTAVLRIGWVMLLGLTVLDVFKFAAEGRPIRVLVLIASAVLLVLFRRDLTNWERGQDDDRR